MSVADDHPTGKPAAERLRLENRFWSKVKYGDEDECWEWQAAANRDGYGYIRLTATGATPAHRVALALSQGLTNPADLPGTVVRHTCSNKRCCNPDHLESGTQADNMDDYFSREIDPETDRKYTPDEIREIRRLASETSMTQSDIGDEYGMVQTMVSNIVRREQYDWVD